jgi:hypothetical protein
MNERSFNIFEGCPLTLECCGKLALIRSSNRHLPRDELSDVYTQDLSQSDDEMKLNSLLASLNICDRGATKSHCFSQVGLGQFGAPSRTRAPSLLQESTEFCVEGISIHVKGDYPQDRPPCQPPKQCLHDKH